MGARTDARTIDDDGIVAQGQGVVVEAVGALRVVGIERIVARHIGGEVAVAHIKAVVHADA